MRNEILLLLAAVYSGAGLAEVPLIVGPEATLTIEDMQRTLATLPPGAPEQLSGSPERLHKMADQTYMAKVAATRARAAGRDKSPEYQALLWNYENNNLALIEANAYVAEHMPPAADLELSAKERYQTNKDKYRTEDSVVASHLLLAVPTESEDAAILEKALKLREEIVEGKISFVDAAKQYSEDKGSGANGGQLGRFGRGKMVKPFEDAVFSMEKPGDVSAPIRTKYGYHLILLHNKYPGEIKEFDQVKTGIIDELKKETATRIREDFWLAIRDDPNAQVNEEAMQQFLKAPGTGVAK